VRDTGVGRQGRQVEQLGGPAGAQPKEILKRQDVRHVQNLPNIALDVGGDIASEPVCRFRVSVVDRRVAAVPERGEQVAGCIGEPQDLVVAKRQERQHRGSTGQ